MRVSLMEETGPMTRLFGFHDFGGRAILRLNRLITKRSHDKKRQFSFRRGITRI